MASMNDFLAEWRSDVPYIEAHTSGSTGTPKSIRLLKTDMRVSAEATNRFFGITHDSVLAIPLSADYIAGKMMAVRADVAGCRLIEMPVSNSVVIDTHIDLLAIVPSQVESVLANVDVARKVGNILVGGGPLSQSRAMALTESGIPSFLGYGMTETCSHVALRRLGSECFSALPGFRFSADPRGCLVINSETMSFGQLVTNDIVELDSPQAFRWRGRFDNVINSGGLKISPEEIEKKIAHLFPDGTNFYITSRRSERWGEEAVLVTDLREPADNLMNLIETEVGHLRAPKALIFDPDIQRTSSKKIIRRKF